MRSPVIYEISLALGAALLALGLMLLGQTPERAA